MPNAKISSAAWSARLFTKQAFVLAQSRHTSPPVRRATPTALDEFRYAQPAEVFILPRPERQRSINRRNFFQEVAPL